MKRFLYTGPMQSLELRIDNPETGEGQPAKVLVAVDCVPGQPVRLPEGHSVTVAFDAAGFLQPAPDEAAPAESVETPPIAIETTPAEPEPTTRSTRR